MIEPIINANGTSRAEHVADRRKAIDAINDALEAIRRLAPNGRDYPGAYDRCEADRDEHFGRLGQLIAIREAIFSEAVAIQRGGE